MKDILKMLKKKVKDAENFEDRHTAVATLRDFCDMVSKKNAESFQKVGGQPVEKESLIDYAKVMADHYSKSLAGSLSSLRAMIDDYSPAESPESVVEQALLKDIIEAKGINLRAAAIGNLERFMQVTGGNTRGYWSDNSIKESHSYSEPHPFE